MKYICSIVYLNIKSFVIITLLVFAQPSFSQDTINIDSLMSAVLVNDDDTLKIATLINTAKKYYNSDIEKSKMLYGYAYDLSLKNNYYRGLSYAGYKLATYFRENVNYYYSIKYYKSCLNAYKNLNDSLNMANVLFWIGNNYYQMSNYEKAKQYYINAQEVYEKIDNKTGISNCFNSLGILYCYFDYDKALSFYNKAIKIEVKHQNIYKCGIFYNNIGNVYMYKNMYKKAKVFLDSALLLSEKDSDYNSLFYTYSSLGEWYEHKQIYTKAELMYFKSYNLYLDKKFSGNIQLTLKQISELYAKMKSYKKAYSYYKMFVEQYNKVTKLNYSRKLYAQEKNTAINKIILQKNLEFKKYKREQRLYIIVVILIFIFSIVIVLFFFYRIKVKFIKIKKLKLQLNNQNNSLTEKILLKNKELTIKSLLIHEKNGLISSVVDKLKVEKKNDNKGRFINDIIKELNSKSNDNYWDEFTIIFENTHPDFYPKLLKDFPKLTATELKMCSLLKLNMSSKEIASLTNMTVSSVEVSRSRLRKSLNLTNSSQSLITFLANY